MAHGSTAQYAFRVCFLDQVVVSIRNAGRMLVVLGLLACGEGAAPTQSNGLVGLGPVPMALYLTATTRIVAVVGGAPELEVSTLVRNLGDSTIQIVVGAQCPLFVQLVPDSTGAFEDSVDPSMACPQGGLVFDLAAGDTITLTRTLEADVLASFASGTYGVNVAVTSTSYDAGVWGAWAGAVQLPLVGGALTGSTGR